MLYTTFIDKVKDRNHSINSTDAGKKSAKSLHCFIIIALHQLNIEGMNLDVRRATHDNYTSNTIFSDANQKGFPLRSEQEKGALLTTFTQYSIKSISQSN